MKIQLVKNLNQTVRTDQTMREKDSNSDDNKRHISWIRQRGSYYLKFITLFIRFGDVMSVHFD